MQEGIWVQIGEFLLNNMHPYHVPFYVLSCDSWGKGILGTGGEELWIKMTRGAGEKKDEGPQSCMTGRARTQGFVRLQPLIYLFSFV